MTTPAKKGWLCGFIVFLLAAAACITARPVAAQLTDEDIERLRKQGEEEGWTFTVGHNDATGYALEDLAGAVEPVDWRDPDRFDDLMPLRGLPDYFDWRDVDGVTPIRNQGGCGSCWAFGAVGAFEAVIKIADGLDVDLSEQWLVSCTYAGSCSGGWHDEACEYMEIGGYTDPCGHNGAVLEEYYGYLASDAPCECPYPHDYWMDSWLFVGPHWGTPTVEQMKQAILDHGPIAVCVRVTEAFQAYSGGIFNACSTGSVNHVVVLTGWDDDQGSNGIWFMRNSWGGWGESGYMRIPYGCSEIGYAALYVNYSGGEGLVVQPTTAAFEPLGDEGGPFSPESKTYTLYNVGDTGFTYEVTKTQPWLTLTGATGYLEAHDSTDVTVSVNSATNALPEGDYFDTLSFTSSTSIGDTTRDVALTVGIQRLIYSWGLSTDPGWTTEGDWAFGQPTGDGGQYGSPDPTRGYLGLNVYGYNLNGDYPNGLSEQHLTTTAIDCSEYHDVTLKFRRWLGVEDPGDDHAYVRVSNNGVNWTTVWENDDEITDSTWQRIELDISAVADHQSTVYVRWTMGTTDNLRRYCGWNIDNIEIWALGGSPPVPSIDHQLVEVPISAAAIADDPALAHAQTFDLQVMMTDDDDWTSTDAVASIDGSFYQHPTYDMDTPQPTWWAAHPSIEFDSFFSAYDFSMPSFAEMPSVTNDSMSAVWFDTENIGNGTYTVGRFTVTSGTMLSVTGTSTAHHTGGELHEFSLDVNVDFEQDCPGDLNGDGQRDQADLGILLASYELDAGGDIDGDGDTDQADLGALLAVYDVPCP
ncbi:MAG: hypothetical protein KAS72_04105 [Phycisphaerales bacterium]|nr:hypothetical protein [Phycisphaerales bacterium]